MTVQKSNPPRSTSRDGVRAYRVRMREKGLRPVTYWLPDVKSPAFREQVASGVIALRHSTEEHDVMAWLTAIGDRAG